MTTQSASAITSSSTYPIENEWCDEKKGLRKELISFKYQSITKANDLSKCCSSITEIIGLKDHHDSQYLRDENNKMEYWIKIANALTPIDCYIEIFLKRMLIGETSRCYIKTNSGDCISFVLRLIRIEFGGYMYSKSLSEIIELAQHFRENGVKMFKKYPLHAHEYFNKAAKILISCEPFDTLKEREFGIDADPIKLQELLETILMNIAACLIKEKRYDDAIHVTEFAERPDNVSEKAIYRRANAFFLLGNLEEAKRTIERINYKENKECLALHTNIVDKFNQSNQNYRKMIKNMFA